jgi:Subtilase family
LKQFDSDVAGRLDEWQQRPKVEGVKCLIKSVGSGATKTKRRKQERAKMQIIRLAKTGTTVFLWFLVFYAGCQNAHEAGSNRGSVEDKAEPPAPQSLEITIIDNEFIVAFSDAYISTLGEKMSVPKTGGSEERIEKLDRFIVEEFGTALSSFDKNYEIFGSTSVCFFVRFKKKASAEEVRGIFPTERVKNVTNNHLRKMEFAAPTLGACPGGEAQWGVVRISNSSKPNGMNYKAAWVIDTGIDVGHSDLNVDGTLSRSFVSGEDLTDYIGHGTHVAGIIAAKADAKGVVGVAPNAPIRGLKVFNRNSQMEESSYIAALQFVKDNSTRGDVVNISIDPGSEITGEQNLIKQIADLGVFVVVAAGNSGASVDGRLFPAAINYQNVVTVSAIDRNDTFASYSNSGFVSVDFAAPGTSICSTEPSAHYGTLSGTSQAAPHVSGLIIHLGKLPNSDGNAKNDPDGNPDPIAHE